MTDVGRVWEDRDAKAYRLIEEKGMTETKTRRSTPKLGRLTLDLEPSVHRSIKVAAAQAGMTMREYITSATLKQMENETRKAS